jgi:glycosyltransferase involved in cell wall biosynthesis
VPLPRRAVLISFEGPDRYSSIGGLGTRVSQLAAALGAAGTTTDVIFAGDPAMRPVDEYTPHVTLRRWSQWISAHYPRNCYDGELEKVADWNSSVPGFVIESIVAPAAAAGERVLIIAEEWQTAHVAVAIDRLARQHGLRDAVTLFWNANNVYGWQHVDWGALQAAATITTVSKYMKFELAAINVPALVIPNGIDEKLLDGADPELVALVKSALGTSPTLFKVGRFDPDKNWLQAVDALAELRDSGIDARLIFRGRRNDYSEEVFGRARERGLDVERMDYQGTDSRKVIELLGVAQGPIIHVRSFLDPTTLFAIYAGVDAVLANSGFEPFGLVGLEVMAAGGIAVCGATGEEYAEPFVNAIVCDTGDGRELATYLRALFGDPTIAERMRIEGAETAARYTWPHALAALERKIAYVDGLVGAPA